MGESPTQEGPGYATEDTIYTRVYSVFVQAFKARTNLCITHSKWGHFFTHLWTCLARTKRGLRPYPLHPYYERVRTVHIVTKRGLKFWPRFVKMSSLWMWKIDSGPRFECRAEHPPPHTHTKYSSSWSVCCIIFLLQYISYKHVFPEVLFEITLSTLSWNELPKGHIFPLLSSGVARAFQGGRLVNHPPGRPKWGRNLRKFEGKWEKLQENEERMRKCSYLAHPRVRGWLRPCFFLEAD